MTTAWLLAVVSSEAQAETLPHQRAWAEETCAAKGWILERVFQGVSTGRDGPRRLLRELIGALKGIAADDRPAWVLMIRADRVGRGRLVESQVALHEIADMGVRIWTRDAGEIRLDSATDQIIAAVKAGLATLENEVRRDKAVSVYRRKVAAGTWTGSKRPYGLAFSPAGDVVVEEQAAVIRQIFAWRAEGHGYGWIAKRAAPIAPPVRFAKGTERALKWTPKRVKELLRNRAFVGTIVDEMTFHRAQAVTATLGRPGSGPNLRKWPMPLIGALRCHCGYRLARKISGPKSDYRSYACVATWNHGNRMRFANAHDVEAQFVALLDRLRADPAALAIATAPAPDTSPALIEAGLRRIERALAENERARERAWTLHTKGTLGDDEIAPRLETLRVEREDLAAQREHLRTSRAALAARAVARSDAEAIIAEAATAYRSASPEMQGRIAAAVAVVVGGLYLDPDKRLCVGAAAPVMTIGGAVATHPLRRRHNGLPM